MTSCDDPAQCLRRALARTQDILDGLEGGDIRATELPELLAQRRTMLPVVEDLTQLTHVESELAQAIQAIDKRILSWCERALSRTRQELSRARRAARPTPSPSARLVSESA